MRKRSEISKSKKASAESRTVPITYDDPQAEVRCTLCDEIAKVADCTKRDNGELECPACGAPITGPAVKSVASKLGIALEEGLGSNVDVLDGPPVMDKEDQKKAEPDLVDRRHLAPKPAEREEPVRGYCGECGTEWPMVNGKLFPNCGHAPNPVDHPSAATHYNPPAGHARATIIGKRLVVERGKHMFPTVTYGNFTVGPFLCSVELTPHANIVEEAKKIRADLKKIADDAFNEEVEWYEEKLRSLQAKG